MVVGIVTSLLAALLASVLVVLQCYLSGSRPAFSLPAFLAIGATAILAIFAHPGRLERAGRWCVAVTGGCFAYLLLRASGSPVEYLARPDFYLALACLAVYFLHVFFITSATDRLSIVWLLLILAGVEVVIGTRQFVGNDWLPFGLKRSVETTTVRASGTFVNPAHLAGFLEIVAPFALALAFWGARKTWVRLLAGYFAAVCYFGIILTGSRGSWISALFTLVVLVILSRDLIRRTSRSRFPAGLYLSIAAAVGAVIFALYFMRQNKALSTRIDLLSDSVTSRSGYDARVYNWLAALEQWQESKWIGTGAGTHYYYGRKYRHEEIQADPVHAHSDYLELLAEYGILGFAGMTVVLLVHAGSGWRGYKIWSARRAERPYEPSPELALNIGSLAAFCTYLAHSMVDFNLHLPGNALTMALVFGILANPSTPAKEDATDEAESAPKNKPSLPEILPRLALPALGLWIILSIGSKCQAELLAEKARVALRDRQYRNSIALSESSLAYDSRNPYIYYQIGEAYRRGAHGKPDAAADPDRLLAEAAYRQALALFDQETVFWIALGLTFDDEAKFQDARAAYERAIALDPHCWHPRSFLAEHFRKIGDPVHEIGTRMQAQRLVPFDVKKLFETSKEGDAPGNKNPL